MLLMKVVEAYTLLMKVSGEVKEVYGLIMEHLSYALKPAEVSDIGEYVESLIWESARNLE